MLGWMNDHGMASGGQRSCRRGVVGRQGDLRFQLVPLLRAKVPDVVNGFGIVGNEMNGRLVLDGSTDTGKFQDRQGAFQPGKIEGFFVHSHLKRTMKKGHPPPPGVLSSLGKSAQGWWMDGATAGMP